jgi:HEAT repeat protein
MKDKVVAVVFAAAFSTSVAAQQIPLPPVPSRPPVTPSALATLPTIALELGDIPVLQQETPETLWRQARGQLTEDNFRRAADLFARLIDRYPKSGYAGDAHYWQAFALQRLGGTANLNRAKTLLEIQQRNFANAGTAAEGKRLRVRVQTELARRGDSDAAAAVTRQATDVLEQQCPRTEDEDFRATALNAMLQMDAERAIPVLKQIMSRRDACSAPLRRRAVFLISQKRSPETAQILLNAARNDPDAEVRQQAVFWLGNVHSEEAIDAIESILNSTSDRQVQEQAIFALSQQRSARASQILRTWARSGQRSAQLRAKAIFHLGQQRDPQNSEFLRSLYRELPAGELKEQVLFALSQRRAEGNERWLMDLAMNEQESIDIRKKALFHAGQMRGVPVQDFVNLYDRVSSREMKEQLIFVYSQRREKEVVDKLMDIVRKEQDKKLRQSALFWLGQSKDPRVVQFILDIIG